MTFPSLAGQQTALTLVDRYRHGGQKQLAFPDRSILKVNPQANIKIC